MNLKKFFYKDYYFHSTTIAGNENRKMDLKKPSDPDEWKTLKAQNEPVLQSANKKLVGYILNEIATHKLNLKRDDLPAAFCDRIQQFSLTLMYPGLFTGSGYNHETGNTGELSLGFYFDHSTGLPILPGSSIKGVLRSVFPQFDNDPFAETFNGTPKQMAKVQFIAELFGLPNEPLIIHQLELAIFTGLDIEATRKLRNEITEDSRQKKALCYQTMPKHDQFQDAFISGPVNQPILGMDAITPHGDNPLKNPIPLPFLKVLPEVTFTFQFILYDLQLSIEHAVPISRKIEAFNAILCTVGAGAKTNVGYGQFRGQSRGRVVKRSGSNAGNNNDDVENPQDIKPPPIAASPIDPKVFTKKPKVGDQVEAKIIENGKAIVFVSTTTNEVKVNGNCPAVSTLILGRINVIKKDGTIESIRYEGPARR